jgi:hypothetical protein
LVSDNAGVIHVATSGGECGDVSGELRAGGVGRATISVLDASGGAVGSFTFDVSEPASASVGGHGDNGITSLLSGAREVAVASVFDNAGGVLSAGDAIVWTSSAPAVVSFVEDNLGAAVMIEAMDPGTTELRASIGEVSATIQVDVLATR